MKNIKQLREEIGISLERFAEILETTQQTITDWEKGQSEPNGSDLRDIAVIFGTSVDDLLGQNPFFDKIMSTRIIMDYSREHTREAFWGNFGVLLPGAKHTKWYPITDGERVRISKALASDKEWVTLSTLNNRVLLINLNNVIRLWLLDDDADQPDDDWKLDGDEYTGLPFEIYRGMDDFARDNDEWFDDTSEKFKKSVQFNIDELNFDKDQLIEKLHNTIFHIRGEVSISFWVKPSDLQFLFMHAHRELSKLICLNDYGNGFENYFNTNNLSMIDMPLIDLIDFSKGVYGQP